ncbi:hypothetical protein OH807_00770 [Kitasatospora sp. NBC_01560]|uniref:hypothetical protein n=1 Tax=Kitasatospora sp. NBC_01560 TaxID=2975965 RepID=UPI0038681C37
MIRVPGPLGPHHPDGPNWERTLREFGRRVAVLAHPHPGWKALHGRQASDGFLTDIDVQYHQDGRHRLLVRTTRPVPADARVRPAFALDGFLQTYIANQADDGSPPLILPDFDGPAVLHLDGTPATATAIAHDGYFALSATLGTETFAVAGTDDLRTMAHHLAFQLAATPR